MPLKSKFEMETSPHQVKEAAAELCAAWRDRRLGWVFDQLSYLTPFQAGIISIHIVRLLDEAGVESSGFLTLLSTRAKHEPAPKRSRHTAPAAVS